MVPAGISRCQPAKTSKLLQEVQTSSQEGVFIQLLGSCHLTVVVWLLSCNIQAVVINKLSNHQLHIVQPMSLNTSPVFFIPTFISLGLLNTYSKIWQTNGHTVASVEIMPVALAPGQARQARRVIERQSLDKRADWTGRMTRWGRRPFAKGEIFWWSNNRKTTWLH